RRGPRGGHSSSAAQRNLPRQHRNRLHGRSKQSRLLHCGQNISLRSGPAVPMSELLPFCHRLLRASAASACAVLLTTSLLCFGAPQALAQQASATYDVELIVFRNLENQSTEHQPAAAVVQEDEDESDTLLDDEGAPAANAPTAQFP